MSESKRNKDIEKIKTINKIKELFEPTEKILNKFIGQIENSVFKKDIDRFFDGYTNEKIFHEIYSGIPWIKLIHPLEQLQYPMESKKNYQVPDFMFFWENGDKNNNPILIELKTLNGNKKSLEIMEKQVNLILNYSKITKIPLVFAIFWKKYQLITFNSIDSFQIKGKNYKITFEEAFANDLSLIFGDLIFSPTLPIYRKTVCDSNLIDGNLGEYENYGYIKESKLSFDGDSFFPFDADLELIQNAIIDSCLNPKKIEHKKNGSQIVILEQASTNFFMKLSTVIMRFVSFLKAVLKDDEKLGPEKIIAFRRHILYFFRQVKILGKYKIPSKRNFLNNLLMEKSFKGTSIYENWESPDN